MATTWTEKKKYENQTPIQYSVSTIQYNDSSYQYNGRQRTVWTPKTKS